MTRFKGNLFVAALGLALYCATAQAVPQGKGPDQPKGPKPSENQGPPANQEPVNLNTCKLDDVSFGDGNAVECLGAFEPFSGNPGKELTLFDGVNGFGSGWLAVTKSDGELSKSFGGIEFDIGIFGDSAKGGFKLSWSGENGGDLDNLPVFVDFVLGLKSATSIAFYRFDDIKLTDAGFGTGTFLSPALNGQGVRQALSHATLFVREGADPCVLNPDGPGCGDGPSGGPAPEPGILSLFGIGMLGLRRFRNRNG